MSHKDRFQAEDFAAGLLTGCMLLASDGALSPQGGAQEGAQEVGRAAQQLVKLSSSSTRETWKEIQSFIFTSEHVIPHANVSGRRPRDPEANQGPQLNAVAIAFIVLSFVTLVLRLISRLRTRVPIGTDDFLILAAAVRFHTSKMVAGETS